MIKTKSGMYLLSLIAITVLAIMVGFMPVSSDTPQMAEITHTGQPSANLDPSICDLDVVDCDNEVEMQIRQIAVEENFQWADYIVRLGNCESGLNPMALGDSGHSRGVFQIHNYYHPEVTDAQAYSVDWSTRWTMNKINQGLQGLWSCDKIV